MIERVSEFLLEQAGPRPWELPEGGRGGFTPRDLFLGKGANALEVAVAEAASRPNVSDVRQLWRRRKANGPSPLVLVILYPSSSGLRAAVCGPVGDDPAVLMELDPGYVERLSTAALAEPSRHAAVRFLAGAVPEAESDMPGVRNQGMFSTNELRTGVPDRPNWSVMSEWGRKIINERGRELIYALGFVVDELSASTSVLRLKETGERSAVAVFLDSTESPDGTSDRFGGTSPITHALEKADAERLPFVVLTRGSQIRIYATGRDVGVGRKGRAETFIEANLTLLPDDRAGYLPTLFGASALASGGSFEEILEKSRDFSVGLGARLRDRVYMEVVPQLAMAIGSRHSGEVTEETLDDLYEQTMIALFRVLFVAYAEDKDLLPYRQNGRYQLNALKTLARLFAEEANSEGSVPAFDAMAVDLWGQVQSLWRAVDKGNSEWGVPAYNGGMFSSDPAVNQAGALLSELKLTNAQIGPALFSLLVDDEGTGVFGPVDFRSLSVREFGTIYEGLLESNLAVADVDLAVDSGGVCVPAVVGDLIVVQANEIYLHNQSGARKATGSYFTKAFAVEHLLDHALEPALDEHIGRLASLMEAGHEADAAKFFFDFRVADIAMGSGHFLVAAVDHMEIRLSNLLAQQPIPGVSKELGRLRAAAKEGLEELADVHEIEDASLLRRQIARRCVYGVDLNLIAVELARLAMWIHTFVPGLPLSFLDHNLVEGNSLTGIGAIEEAATELGEAASNRTGRASTPAFGRVGIEERINHADEALRRLARSSDASAAEIRAARRAHADAAEATMPARRLFDLLIAHRLDEIGLPYDDVEGIPDEAVESDTPLTDTAADVCGELKALHFPIAFPEVFLRTTPGFDVIIGNPPWEEATVEELGFWALRFPGLKSMPQGDQRREIGRLKKARPDLISEYKSEVEGAERLRVALTAGPYPGMGTGDPDLYKAFVWRFWQLVRDGGSIGVVLPRSALSAAGSGPWREAVLGEGAFEDVTTLLNTAGWVFDEAEHRYTIGLVTVRKGAEHAGDVRLLGPFNSYERFEEGVKRPAAVFPSDQVAAWTINAAFPLLPSDRSVDVFLKLRSHPRFDSTTLPWSARPVRELDATNDKGEMVFDPRETKDLWPVFKGASFNLWNPDNGNYYAWADPSEITDYLQQKRQRQARTQRSAFHGMPETWVDDSDTLPCRQPRIAFRDIARATDTRTVIAALIPAGVVINNTGPYLLFSEDNRRDEAYLLGVLSSIPLDWYARRFVEIHVNFHILNAFPIPAPEVECPIRRRVVEIAGVLAAVDERYASWAEGVGVPVASIETPAAKADLIAELDAAVALLYGLDEDDLKHVFETFHEGWEFNERLNATLVHYRRLRSHS